MALMAATLRVPHGEHFKKLAELAYRLLTEGFVATAGDCRIPGLVFEVSAWLQGTYRSRSGCGYCRCSSAGDCRIAGLLFEVGARLQWFRRGQGT